MYRRQGTSGVLRGVLSGPYTGGKRRLDAAKLPPAALRRLADALAGRGEPSVIVHERPGSRLSWFSLRGRLGTWSLLFGLFGLAALMAIGFGDPRAAWAYHPREAAALYVLVTVVAAFSVLSLLRRRALVTDDALLPGRYLLPLDVIEVPARDPRGDQIIVITPLGDARDVRVRSIASGAPREELVILLDDTAEIVFVLRSAREGEAAIRRLEHTQHLLEELTYKGDLEKSLLNDPLFDLRVDASWDSVAPSPPSAASTPSSPASARTPRARAKTTRAMLHGRLTTLATIALGTTLGLAALAGRNHMADRALYVHALRAGTPEALDAYLTRADAYRADGERVRDRLREQRDELARRSQESRSRALDLGTPRAEWELTAEEASLRRGTYESCLAALRARAAPEHPEVTRIMEALVSRARTTGDRVVPVRMDAHVGDAPPGVPPSDHERRMATTTWALERAFSEACPASLVKLAVVPFGEGLVGAGLDVRVSITYSHAPRWTRAAAPQGNKAVAEMKIYAMKVDFDVTLRATSAGERASFHLTMPFPEAPSMSVRPRSLFILAGEPAPEGTFDDRVYASMSARAFDRLYDELHALFFRGDPRVPLHGDDVEP